MPYVTNAGVRLHYRTEGAGPPLFMQHGFTDSLETWYELGYVEGLKQDYRLILLDARGHGHSQKPHDSDAYSMAIMASDVLAVLDAEALPSTHFLGYSMGGGIGFALAKHFAERVNSLVLGGAAPYTRDPALVPPRIEQLRRVGPQWGETLSPALEARLQANDVEALVAVLEGFQEKPGQMDDLPPTMHMPCLLFVGEDDPSVAAVKNCSTEMPNATLVTLPGLNHASTFLHSEIVLTEIRKFLDAVVYPSHSRTR